MRRTLLTRFIPAGAGNTHSLRPRPGQQPVHPRWRGEHPRVAVAGFVGYGSSPLARGTLRENPSSGPQGRFIPAGAGNTSVATADSHPTTVHPRWRGEHWARAMIGMPSSGSSPLARGTPGCAGTCPAPGRFIPAGAGNTVPAPCAAALTAVHPRWRGEHFSPSPENISAPGSSPLARGTRAVRHRAEL